MPKSALTPSVLSLLVLLAPAAATGCSNYGEGDDAAAGGANGAPGAGGNGGANGGGPNGGASGGGPKAPPVQATPPVDELVESLGVFVTPSGSDTGDGTRKQPLARVQAGIDLGKKLGKRVYVCTGTYAEALALADSISVIGGLGCANPAAWTTGQPKSRLEAPTSPAIVAKGMTTDTRLEGFDVVAPDATEPSASSIGLLAVGSPKLVIAATKITAGNAANGADGAEGVQLVQAGTPAGAATGWEDCSWGPETCKSFAGAWVRPSGGAGATSICNGVPGHDGERGGQGGSGGLQEVVLIGGGGLGGPSRHGLQSLFANDAAYGHTPGEARTGAPGADGTDGANGGDVGTLTESGYAPADGMPGRDGFAGNGGAGGAGLRAGVNAIDHALGTRFHGDSGAGGGAGGCPGLAGGAGKGGGASLAAVLLESPVVLDGVALTSKHGGDAGRGTFGSDPTQGGAAGTNPIELSRPALSGRPGGSGGAAGVSGNGSAGPSIALVTKGAAPTIKGATTTTAGEPGAGVEERSRTGALGHAKTIPATPAGLAKATHTL